MQEVQTEWRREEGGGEGGGETPPGAGKPDGARKTAELQRGRTSVAALLSPLELCKT